MHVFLFVPNVIGYVRLLFLCMAVFYFESYYFKVFYGLNFVLDGIDGTAARYFNQCTRFGYALDMILDRIGSTLLFIKLSHLHLKELWILCMFLDISSHWFATLSSSETHKKPRNQILKLYYDNLLLVCLCSEGFLMLMIDAQLNNSALHWALYFALGVAFMFKQIVNVKQLQVSALDLSKKPSF